LSQPTATEVNAIGFGGIHFGLEAAVRCAAAPEGLLKDCDAGHCGRCQKLSSDLLAKS